MTFANVCAKSAVNIRAGSLRSDPTYSQVKPNSYEPLAKMNDLEFLTCDSQDGQQDERSYVDGFMKTNRVRKFCENVNMETDKIAFVLQPCPRDMYSHITVTRHGKLGNRKSETRTFLYNKQSTLAFLRRDAGVDPNDNTIVFVCCIDPRWERVAYGRNGLFGDVVRALQTS